MPGILHASEEVVLRSVNLHGEDKPVGGRMCGLAAELLRANSRIDFLALQEVVDGKKCPVTPQGGSTSAHCLVAALRSGCSMHPTTPQRFSVVTGGGLAIVKDSGWQVLSQHLEVLGNDDCSILPDSVFGLGKRFALRVIARNSTNGAILRLYNAHLSHHSSRCGEQHFQRLAQVKKLVALTIREVIPEELPPIVAGDLNFYPYSEITSHDVLAEKFQISLEGASAGDAVYPRYDQIWLGRKSAFPGSRPWLSWRPLPDLRLAGEQTVRWKISYNVQDCRRRNGCEKSWFGKLTDHDSPGVALAMD